VFTGLLGLVLFVALLGLVVFQTVLVQRQSQLDDLDQQIESERDRIEQAELDVTELESPERIVEEARSDLGMVAPPEVGMLHEVLPGEAPLSEPIPGPPPVPQTGDRSAG
jgi:cell division protein FtsL